MYWTGCAEGTKLYVAVYDTPLADDRAGLPLYVRANLKWNHESPGVAAITVTQKYALGSSVLDLPARSEVVAALSTKH
jgi:hypothetical protein